MRSSLLESRRDHDALTKESEAITDGRVYGGDTQTTFLPRCRRIVPIVRRLTVQRWIGLPCPMPVSPPSRSSRVNAATKLYDYENVYPGYRIVDDTAIYRLTLDAVRR